MTWTVPSGATSLQARVGSSVYPAGRVGYELRNAGAYAPGNWTIHATDASEGRVGITIEILPAAGGGGGATQRKNSLLRTGVGRIDNGAPRWDRRESGLIVPITLVAGR